MLITKTVITKWDGKTKKHYEEKGYKFTKWKEEFEVKTEDLSSGNGIKIEVKCDCQDCKNPNIKQIRWCDYLRCVKKYSKYYCQKCISELFCKEKARLTKLKNSISFERWCIDNNRQDILDRWDYNLNSYKPSEIGYGAHKKYYFKCQNKIHKSELKNINGFTSGQEGSMYCRQCNSFAQWGIDNLGEDFLEKYWDYEKNTVNPWEISYGSRYKIFIICQEVHYHGSYDIECNCFTDGHRCSYCGNQKVHPLDSIGQYILDNYGQEFLNSIWSEKNIKSPFEYSYMSNKKVWWKCLDGKHEDCFRDIVHANRNDFRCSECGFSKGEKRIEEWLLNNCFININSNCGELENKDSKYYIIQKEFDELIGLKGGNLSYDFYLPQYNLLIEYQGEQHECPVDFYGEGIKKAEQNFIKQQEHDRRKKQYAEDNNINLLEIWYWHYDNIEKILNNLHIIK